MAENSSLSDGTRQPVDPDRPLLDRSRARLRLPADLLQPALDIARYQSMSIENGAGVAGVGPRQVKRLADISNDDGLDPIAAELLQVVNQASLMVAVDVSYGPDSSAATIWATPRRAVASNPFDPAQIELEMVPVNQLPQILGQMIVLQSPAWVAEGAISVGVRTLSTALSRSSRDKALEVLAGDGLDTEQALLVLDLQLPDVRRWRISSSWSTEGEPDEAALVGLDAGPSGQWLDSTSGADGDGLRTFTPLGHGEGLSALRAVLPRNWMGTPLQRVA